MEMTREIQDALAAEFPNREIKWLPKITTKKGANNTRVNIERNGQRVAGCMAHIDARQVMNRLDDVVGVGNWSDSYQPAAIGKGVECTLTVCGISKTDVGTVSDQDPEKGAYSDALKRAAVKFGIGRHLYDIDTQWLPFDGYKITSKPTNKPVEPPQKKQSTASKPPAPATKPMPPHAIADLRASIEGGTDGNVTLGFIIDRATMTGHYNAGKHSWNAAMKWEGWPEENGKWSKNSLKNNSIMNADKGLALFDWLVARKEAE